MFSPAVHSARQRILNAMLAGSNEANTSDVLGLTAFNPDTLSGADQDAFYDLEELEEQHRTYLSRPFEVSTLTFLQDKALSADFTPDFVSIFDLLPVAHPATQHLAYRLQGLKSLSLQLESVECSHPELITQCSSLKNAIELDIQSLVLAVWMERSLRGSFAEGGLRVVKPESEYLIRPYTSPLATSVIILTAVIHAIMGVAREPCNYILSALRCILSMAISMQNTQSARFIQEHIGEIPTTLPTALHYLNLSPQVYTYIVCPKCSSLYDEGPEAKSPQSCTYRDLDGALCNEDLFTTSYYGGKMRQRPTSRYSHFPLENWLSELLLRPGVEDLIEAATPAPSSTLHDVWNAPYLCTFPGPMEPSFFSAPPEELRIVMLLFHDFFNPLGMKTSGKVKSIGGIFMICLNLPPDLRYDTSYAYLASIVPGPSEPKTVNLHHFFRPIIENVSELYSPGIWISKTHKYPKGWKVRVAVPLSCMDILAARAVGGFAPHTHTCFCNMCNALLRQIHHNSLDAFRLRDIVSHQEQVAQWNQAPSLSQQNEIYSMYGVRRSEWLRFPWWNPFYGMPVGPMHWSKNICEKQLRINMGWSWENQTGVPDAPDAYHPVSDLEYEWGKQALYRIDGSDFVRLKLTSGLAHYLCREQDIYEAGLSVETLLLELNEWRIRNGIIDGDGKLTSKAKQDIPTDALPVSVARAHFYLSKATTAAYVESHASTADLGHLCARFQLPAQGTKSVLAERLYNYHSKFRISYLPNSLPQSKSRKTRVSVLGADILAEVRDDMGRTTLPRWLKHPPKNFATVSHGKLQAEEYISLTMVSFVITLVRIWGRFPTGEYRERLDHFLHMMLSVRILAFQSLVESDIQAFEHHYGLYLAGLTKLYPYETRTCVQHLGLHIPTFLRALGPSTRFSESTCEMFNGLLQDISNNFKFGEMEITLHREFIMAARLKGLLQSKQHTSQLGDFGIVTQNYIQKRVPGYAQQAWHAAHSANAARVDDATYKYLCDWSTSASARSPSRQLFICSSIQRGNVFYAPFASASGDSCVLFSPPCEPSFTPSDPIPGQIDAILKEPDEAVPANSQARILLLIRPFLSLEPPLAKRDPYWNHPIVGEHGARLARIYYDQVQDFTYVIEPRELVAHVAVCNYHDPDHTFPQPCVVVLSLDLKHKRYA